MPPIIANITAAQLQIEPQDRERFIDAFVQLMQSIEDPVWKMRLCVAVTVAAKWQDAGRELPWTLDAILAGVVVRVVLQHMYQGFPLALPVAVIDAYAAAGEKLETPLFECENCGYALPRSFATCPLCGGRTGVGAYSVRRSRRAACN